MLPEFDVRIVHSVREVDQPEWDDLGQGMAFTSYRWYLYGETVMRDCIPVYILVNLHGKAIARATFWVIRNEPLPIVSTILRDTAQLIFKRWPLFVCRSPLSNTSGLILPDNSFRQPALKKLVQAAQEEAKKHKTSFLMFDYMEEEETKRIEWPKGFGHMTVPDPSNKMRITWTDFDQYLASRSPKMRKHYRRYQREVEALQIKIESQKESFEIEPAMRLIRTVERRHHSTPNPWFQAMLEKSEMVNGRVLTARMEDRLIGSELVVEDNGTQMVTALGMAEEYPHVYFWLGFADIRWAIEQKKQFLAWGSGAEEVKQRLGFEPEFNNRVIFQGCNRLTRWLSAWIARG